MSWGGKLLPWLPLVFAAINIYFKKISDVLNTYLISADISMTLLSFYTGLLLRNINSGSYDDVVSHETLTEYFLVDLFIVFFWFASLTIGSKKNATSSIILFFLSIAGSYSVLSTIATKLIDGKV